MFVFFLVVLGLLGSIVPTVLGYVILSERTNAANGLHAYNGFLVGLGAGYFNANISLSQSDYCTFALLIVPVIILAITTFYFHIGIRSLFPSLPPFTLAYNLVLSCWLIWTMSLGTSSSFSPSFTSSNLAPLNQSPIEFSNISLGWFMKATLSGVGQVYFMPDLLSSILILGGLVLGSPLIGLMALLGSAVGLFLTVISHGPMGPAELGLSGYNAVLVSIGIGCFYYVFSWASLAMAGIGGIASVFAQSLFSNFLVHPVGPALTLPFCFVGALLHAAGPSVGLVQVPPHTLDFPEAHVVKASSTQSESSHKSSLDQSNSTSAVQWA